MILFVLTLTELGNQDQARHHVMKAQDTGFRKRTPRVFISEMDLIFSATFEFTQCQRVYLMTHNWPSSQNRGKFQIPISSQHRIRQI